MRGAACRVTALAEQLGAPGPLRAFAKKGIAAPQLSPTGPSEQDAALFDGQGLVVQSELGSGPIVPGQLPWFSLRKMPLNMSKIFWLTEKQLERLRPFFPKSHGRPGVDDRRILSGIIFIKSNCLKWCDAPAAHGPHKTLHNRWKRWSEMGVFARMFEGPAAEPSETTTVLIDATHLKAHRTASSLRVKKGRGRRIGRTKGGMTSKLHAIAEAEGRPLRLFMTAGQMNDYTGARALLSSLPKAQRLLGDRR